MKSPGHRAHPEHKVIEKRIAQRMKVEIDGQVIAESGDVIEVDEDGYPPRYYFPRADVRMELLSPSKTTTHCPFKGTAHYYGVRIDGRTLDDTVWTYEEPYEEHLGLQDRVAFWEERIPAVERVIERSPAS
jgi:uncharacterized protein (DUF427 family)